MLFACTFNAVRSPMAEGLLRDRHGRRVYVELVGIRQGSLDPFAVQVMDEIGIDISGHEPRTFDEPGGQVVRPDHLALPRSLKRSTGRWT